MESIPREVIVRHLLKYLDIDSRRALNVYSRLDIPSYFNEMISNIPKPLEVNYNKYILTLGNIYIIDKQIYNYIETRYPPTRITYHPDKENPIYFSTSDDDYFGDASETHMQNHVYYKYVFCSY